MINVAQHHMNTNSLCMYQRKTIPVTAHKRYEWQVAFKEINGGNSGLDYAGLQRIEMCPLDIFPYKSYILAYTQNQKYTFSNISKIRLCTITSLLAPRECHSQTAVGHNKTS